MAPCKRQVKARRHLLCDHCHSFVDLALSGCVKSWAETMEEDCTFQCMVCWKLKCLTAELARLTSIRKGMDIRMTKETGEIESVDKERGWKEQCSDNKDEERRLRGGRANARKHMEKEQQKT